ncbi:hypothetical protein [Ferruginivarius sediminum]|uniref:Uncharacterized protein n=1 Tax=Ferruginivarius sediminum TaxID=2661937 RepID=A0A369TAY5_9PROT|nr:hypothetical protein [Ferruginivarius sediminum]RDD62450.1 hypothetical protein DRB17_07305 [Ferruginivarius sediminum]
MNISDRISAAKPFVIGGVVGAVAALIVGFSGNMLVSTGTMEEKVTQARIEAFSQICDRNARAHWQSQGKEIAALDGWRNDEREALAEKFAKDLSSDTSLSRGIVDRCEDLLRAA